MKRQAVSEGDPGPSEETTTNNAPPTENSFGVRDALVAGVFLGAIGLGFVVLIVSNFELEWTWKYWTGEPEPNIIEAIRNLGLIALGGVGLFLAIWRSILAHRQTQTGLRQAETANKQAETSERGLIIDRYQKGALMLESEELSVRIAGVFALRELALSDPTETYFLVLDVLYAFVRESSKQRQPIESTPEQASDFKIVFTEFGADLIEAIEATSLIRTKVARAESLENTINWLPNLRFANLSGAVLWDFKLSGAILWRAELSGTNLGRADLSDATLWHSNLSNVRLRGTNLSRAKLVYANLTNAKLEGANLSGADLSYANLSGADLRSVEMDQQTDLRKTWAYEDNPPKNVTVQIENIIVIRKKDETWPDFVDRIIMERLGLDWRERDKFVP